MATPTRFIANRGLSVRCAIALHLVTSAHPLAAQNEAQPHRIVAFDYPALARTTHLQGQVELVASMTPDGAVSHVKVRSGNPILAAAAAAAVSRWTFSGCSAGAPCELTLIFSFVLEGGACRSDQNCPKDFVVDLPDHILVKSSPLVGSIN